MATRTDQEVKQKVEQELEITPPKNYKVIMYNNQTTLHMIVIEVLRKVFGLDEGRAYRIMRTCEITGVSVIIVAPRDIAEEKCKEAMSYKEELATTHNGHAEDLQFTCEPAD